jgi:hypothetical protein
MKQNYHMNANTNSHSRAIIHRAKASNTTLAHRFGVRNVEACCFFSCGTRLMPKHTKVRYTLLLLAFGMQATILSVKSSTLKLPPKLGGSCRNILTFFLLQKGEYMKQNYHVNANTNSHSRAIIHRAKVLAFGMQATILSVKSSSSNQVRVRTTRIISRSVSFKA